jgi:hypothetical protein
MKSKLVGCLAATVIGAAIAAATAATAGGVHGSFGGGGHFGGGGFHGGMVSGRSVFVPGGNRFAGTPFAGRRVFGDRLDRDDFAHRRFRNFAIVGAPFLYDYSAYGNGCWQQEWISYGWQWINICDDYGD